MTENEAKKWLALGEAVEQEFGCTVLFIVDDEGREQFSKLAEDKKNSRIDG